MKKVGTFSQDKVDALRAAAQFLSELRQSVDLSIDDNENIRNIRNSRARVRRRAYTAIGVALDELLNEAPGDEGILAARNFLGTFLDADVSSDEWETAFELYASAIDAVYSRFNI